MARKGDTREQLIQSAARLMYARGYTAVGVKDVCEGAGVKKGSFYYFFPSKQALALAVLDRQWDITQHYLLEPAFKADLPVLERFQRLFQMVAEMQKDKSVPIRGCFFGNLALELSTQDEQIRQKLQDIFQAWAGYFERTLAEGVATGELAEIDPQATAQAILAYFEGVALLAKTHNNLALVKHLGQGVNQLIISSRTV